MFGSVLMLDTRLDLLGNKLDYLLLMKSAQLCKNNSSDNQQSMPVYLVQLNTNSLNTRIVVRTLKA